MNAVNPQMLGAEHKPGWRDDQAAQAAERALTRGQV
jgi:hypothetical protein